MRSFDNHPAHDLFDSRRLRGRGWTNAMIRDLLGEPAGYRTDYAGNGQSGTMRHDVWLGEEIRTIEASAEFARRAGRARRVIAEDEPISCAEVLEEARSSEITLSIIPRASLRAASSLYGDSRKFQGRTRQTSDDKNAQVNYLRHQCSNYDELWRKHAEHEAGDEAHDIIYARVMNRIGADYPHLANECERRMQRRRMAEADAVHEARA